MDEDKKNNQSDETTQRSEDFNRTVVVSKPKWRTGNPHSTPLHKMVTHFGRKRQEVDDIIGGMNVSQYTNVEPDTSAELSAPLSTLDSKYAVLEEFAAGGHATVSIARDKNLRRIVAIKSLKNESKTQEELVESFVSEAKVTAQLDHPAIIPIYGLTCDGENGVHLVMKLVNGKTLRDYLRNIALNYRIKGIKTFDEAAMLRKRLEIFLRVCDAIAYAHNRNIMHCDLKPENIMLGEYMEVYVMDWGLAKMIPKEDEKPDPDSKLSGTPRYFSPEALRGERCDARSDIFTLGLILQEVVTLEFAVKGKDEKEYMDRIINGELQPVVHLFKWRIDRALKAIIMKATAYRMEDRYQTVSELAEDLRRYMGGLSVSAYPDDWLMRTTRFLYRHRKGVTALFLAILFVSASVTAYSIHRQLETSRAMTLQRRAMNYIYDRTATVANHIDTKALHIQEQLSALSRIAAYLISYNNVSTDADAQKRFRPAMDRIGKTEPGMFYSPYYKRMVALDYGIHTAAPNADQAMSALFMRKVSPVLTKMKNIVLGSKSGYGFAKQDYEKKKAEYLYQGFPIRSVYIGSRYGIKLLYPWRGNYSRKIDPRQRVWYKNAVNKSSVVWGKPYMDLDSVSGLSIPCSVPIYNLDGEFCGVAGVDISVNQATTAILSLGNVGDYVLEKAVINRAGETVFSSLSHYYNKTFDPAKYHQDAHFKTPLFRTKNARNRILKRDKDFGTFLAQERGREVIYSFAYLDVIDMFYVVVADYRKLLEHVNNQQK